MVYIKYIIFFAIKICAAILLLNIMFILEIQAYDEIISIEPTIEAEETPFQGAIRKAQTELADRNDQAATAGWSISDVLAIVAMMAAVGLMVCGIRWSRKLVPKVGSAEMRILDRMMLSKNSTLFVVRLRGRDYWIADSCSGIILLSDFRSTIKKEEPGCGSPPNEDRDLSSPLHESNMNGLFIKKDFSQSEKAFLGLVSRGKSRTEISCQLDIPEEHFNKYVANILEKTEYDSISKLARHAVENGIVYP